MRTNSLFSSKKSHITTAINVIMIVFSMKTLYDIIKNGYYAIKNNNIWSLHEFYINYQGGFIRRGLFGEIIYQFCLLTGANPQFIVGIICILCFIFVIYTFFIIFKKNGIKWWILPLSIFLASLDVVRKDFFFITNLILILYTYRSSIPIWLKVLIINIIVIFTILCHEAFFFVCVPFLTLIILRDKITIPSFTLRVAACLPIWFAMFVVTRHHGDLVSANVIQQSWANIIPNWDPNLPFDDSTKNYAGSIGALAWTTEYAAKLHFSINFLYTSLRIPGYIIRPIAIILLFYFALNYIKYFSSNKTHNRTHLFFNIFLFQFLSLLPMFTILSCDTRRICFYWFSSSFAFFLILSEEILIRSFHYWYHTFTLKIQTWGCKVLPSNKTITLFLIFLVCAPYTGNNIVNAITSSVIMQYVRIIIDFLNIL